MPLADAPAHIELTQAQYHHIQVSKPEELDPKQKQSTATKEANARVLEYLEKSLKAYEPAAAPQLISVVENEPNAHKVKPNGLSKIEERNSFAEDEARAGASGRAAAVIKLHQNAVIN